MRVSPHSKSKSTLSFDWVTFEQLSGIALKLFSQKTNCSVIFSEQLIFKLFGGLSHCGAVVSATVMICDILLSLLQLSVKVQVRVIITSHGLVVSTESVPITVISPSQLSVAVNSADARTSFIHS